MKVNKKTFLLTFSKVKFYIRLTAKIKIFYGKYTILSNYFFIKKS